MFYWHQFANLILASFLIYCHEVQVTGVMSCKAQYCLSVIVRYTTRTMKWHRSH